MPTPTSLSTFIPQSLPLMAIQITFQESEGVPCATTLLNERNESLSPTMAEEEFLPAELDILAGIVAFNNESNIRPLAGKLSQSLQAYFPDRHSLLALCDGGSTDNTIKAFSELEMFLPKKVFSLAGDELGKGTVLKSLFAFTKQAKPKAILVNSGDIRNLNPEWVKLQTQSILEQGYDFAAPFYASHKFDGYVTNHVVYPLVYGLLCHDLRQPIGGDYAFTSMLPNYWLQANWPVNASQFGIDIFMTCYAIISGASICQVNLRAKEHNVIDPTKTISPMFRQTVSTLFKIVLDNARIIKDLRRVQPVPHMGDEKADEPPVAAIDPEGVKEKFVTGFVKHREMIASCITDEDFTRLRNLVQHDSVHIPAEMWARIVYDFIIAFKRDMDTSSEVMKAFIPVMFGRMYTFMTEVADKSTEETEKLVKAQAEVFFEQRGYLLKRL